MTLCKHFLRTIWKNKRHRIFARRSFCSAEKAKESLAPELNKHTFILSYASFATEFDTGMINHLLSGEKKLVLPKVEKSGLTLYHVINVDTQTRKNKWSIPEPIPELCKEVEPSLITLALIPGLAFDRDFHRLGYGKGFYDRLIPSFHPKTAVLGLGFKEQLLNERLPATENDVPLHGLLLF